MYLQFLPSRAVLCTCRYGLRFPPISTLNYYGIYTMYVYYNHYKYSKRYYNDEFTKPKK